MARGKKEMIIFVRVYLKVKVGDPLPNSFILKDARGMDMEQKV